MSTVIQIARPFNQADRDKKGFEIRGIAKNRPNF
jgi:hypothetical protein